MPTRPENRPARYRRVSLLRTFTTSPHSTAVARLPRAPPRASQPPVVVRLLFVYCPCPCHPASPHCRICRRARPQCAALPGFAAAPMTRCPGLLSAGPTPTSPGCAVENALVVFGPTRFAATVCNSSQGRRRCPNQRRFDRSGTCKQS